MSLLEDLFDEIVKEVLIDDIMESQLNDYFVRDELVKMDYEALWEISRHLEEITS